ncbi:MAG: ammonium transporter, partial [Thermoproteota archaeon]|nr:ammonium transporter [Thermoproteota archaeon]
MLGGKTKGILDRKITFLGLAAIIAALAAVNFSETAHAYAPDDPAAVYSCFETNEDGSFVTQTNNETGEAELVPCEIDTGDHAWMLTSSALVLMMTPAGLAMFYGGLSRQ